MLDMLDIEIQNFMERLNDEIKSSDDDELDTSVSFRFPEVQALLFALQNNDELRNTFNELMDG